MSWVASEGEITHIELYIIPNKENPFKYLLVVESKNSFNQSKDLTGLLEIIQRGITEVVLGTALSTRHLRRCYCEAWNHSFTN